MSHIRSVFSIKDLENFSGIKAHTIRIWEKRYELLHPERTDTNIRYYSLKSLKKLLNIALLNSEGHKISKIAKYDEAVFEEHLREVVNNKVNKTQFINELKIAMLNFDVLYFEEAYLRVEKVIPFSDIFKNYFIPFLGDIGLLWQTGSINPTHEHFISNIIKQKILIETHRLQLKKIEKHDKLFVLFLPYDEIHDLGLTYLHYEVLKLGYKSIMLGPSVPIDSLKSFVNDNQEVNFISYFTVEPPLDKIPEYLTEFETKILEDKNANFYVLGKQITNLDTSISMPKRIKFFSSIDDIMEFLEE
ncbi:MerR family transcriptional regulator [Pseudofulvibacter geojedonensis]|uniref:MerR family transcriptional regulator n=1 Tax=Pseudofulvibacter geojedonensis TaxID=1123758 RepID=A0ABW3I2A7_9FLAO